jgi:Fe-S cluster assembly protein SufD
VTEIAVGEGAVLRHYKLQRESREAFHLQTIAVRQARASHFTSVHAAFGGALARTDIRADLEGEGSECILDGLFVGAGSQHLDTHTTISHAAPHTTSREVYRGVLDGRARGVFHGRIVVRPGAQKTDAMQTNKNLLLSRDALVDSTPALEIFADDVKCKHGSTIGQLDATALFYLRSRGIGEREARAILTRAFAADVAGRVALPSLRAEIEETLDLSLSDAAREEESS